MKLIIDRNIYSDGCISNVVYWFSDKYTFQRSIDGTDESIQIEGVDNEDSFKHVFYQKLNDYKLREIIDKETKDIKTILYAKAFGEFDELTEEDILE